MRALHGTVSAGFDAVLSRADEQFQWLLQTQDDEAEHGPRLFTLEPADTTWRKPGWVKARFVLTLFCEHSHLPIRVLGDDPKAGVYELEMAREWLVKAAPVAKVVAGVLSVALPVAKVAAQIELGDAAWKGIKDQVDSAKESLGTLADDLAKDLSEVVDGDKTSSQFLEASPVLGRSGGVLRRLHDVLQSLDPGYGGLEKVRNNRGKVRWVHPRFVEIYNPKPPVVRASGGDRSST